MKKFPDGNIYCECGHAIISHDPAKETFVCCVKGCDCKQFKKEQDAEARRK
jgi:hypothetical protein